MLLMLCRYFLMRFRFIFSAMLSAAMIRHFAFATASRRYCLIAADMLLLLSLTLMPRFSADVFRFRRLIYAAMFTPFSFASDLLRCALSYYAAAADTLTDYGAVFCCHRCSPFSLCCLRCLCAAADTPCHVAA